MRATIEATEAYHANHPGLGATQLGRTGLRVSAAGFGSYRVSLGVEAHRLALRHALLSGINLIDTSANYADGASEELIGHTIAELVRDGLLTRNQIVVVSKGGYIQGSNLVRAKERVEAGGGYPDIVQLGAGLWHCIAPEFLQEQISLSLNRLGLVTIDVYLLHNPEYYLKAAERAGVPLEQARAEYHRRIKDAFTYLETEVEAGRIGAYGISSNSFPHPASDAELTSLEEVVKIAERISLVHHFSVIQLPANLLETGFVAEKNQSGERTVMEVAREKGLGVLLNRPLNAIVGQGLVRLADFTPQPISADEIRQRIDAMVEQEREFALNRLEDFADDPDGKRALREFISVGLTLQRYWATFGSIEQYNDVLTEHFAPRLAFCAQYLREQGAQEHIDWYAGYVAHARALLHAVGSWYARPARERARRFREAIVARTGPGTSGSLSALAIRLLLGVDGVDSVLVGMRREEYVDDVLTALRQGKLGDEKILAALGGELAGIIREMEAEPEEEPSGEELSGEDHSAGDHAGEGESAAHSEAEHDT